MYKLFSFFLTIAFLYLIYSLGRYNMNKTRHDHESNLRKWMQFRVGAILSEQIGFNDDTLSRNYDLNHATFYSF